MADDPEPVKCPIHGVPMFLRKNVKTGEEAMACIFCDVERQRGRAEPPPSDVN